MEVDWIVRRGTGKEVTINYKIMTYGIITHYDVHNHGAILQLMGLIRILKDEFRIKAQALQFDKNYDFLGREMKAKYEISLKSVGVYAKYFMENGLSQFLYNYEKKRLLDRFKKEHQMIGPYYTKCGELDGVVMGSDEIFALHTGPTPVLFGHACPSKKVFVYGGCFGPTTIEEVKRLHCRGFVASGLNAMKGLGMRDRNSREIATILTGRETVAVCDPVILYGYEEETKNMKSPNLPPYLLVYAYDKKMNEPKEITRIKAYAKANGLKIVSPGFFHSWVDYNINVDPVELLRYFKHAECVVTDTFHGSVMSIITGRELAVKLRDNANKLLNLLEEYGLEDRVLSSEWNLEEIFSKKVDYQAVNAEVIRRRNDSLSYLRSMIED